MGLFDFDEMVNTADHPAHGRIVRTGHRVTDPAKTERAERPALFLRTTNRAALLGDLQIGHATTPSPFRRRPARTPHQWLAPGPQSAPPSAPAQARCGRPARRPHRYVEA